MLRVPLGIGFDHRVEDDQELSHAGREDHLGDFAGGFEAFCELVEDGVVFHSGQGSHVEDTTERFAPAADETIAAPRAAVVGIGSQADEGGDFLPVELSQFREFSHEGGSRHVTDAGDGLEELEALLPVVVGLDEFQDRAVQSSDVLGDGALDAPSHELGQVVVETVGFGCAEVNQLASARNSSAFRKGGQGARSEE
jgi:hypothetical protein